jgi:hypothetical protein
MLPFTERSDCGAIAKTEGLAILHGTGCDASVSSAFSLLEGSSRQNFGGWLVVIPLKGARRGFSDKDNLI